MKPQISTVLEYIEQLHKEIEKLEELYERAIDNNSFIAALGARKEIRSIRNEITSYGVEYGEQITELSKGHKEEEPIYTVL